MEQVLGDGPGHGSSMVVRNGWAATSTTTGLGTSSRTHRPPRLPIAALRLLLIRRQSFLEPAELIPDLGLVLDVDQPVNQGLGGRELDALTLPALDQLDDLLDGPVEVPFVIMPIASTAERRNSATNRWNAPVRYQWYAVPRATSCFWHQAETFSPSATDMASSRNRLLGSGPAMGIRDPPREAWLVALLCRTRGSRPAAGSAGTPPSGRGWALELCPVAKTFDVIRGATDDGRRANNRMPQLPRNVNAPGGGSDDPATQPSAPLRHKKFRRFSCRTTHAWTDHTTHRGRLTFMRPSGIRWRGYAPRRSKLLRTERPCADS